jgi:hypothetical protein
MKKVLSTLLVLILVLGVGGYLLASSADASEPGDTLYSVDILAEDVQRIFAFNALDKAELEQAILDERAEELLALLEKEADEDVVKGAVDSLDKQRIRAEERIQLLADEKGNIEDADLTRVQNRYEKQVEEQLMNMEKVQNKYMNIGEETKKGFEDAAKQMNGNTQQNMEENTNKNQGEATEQKETNQESNGNSDGGSANGNNGSSGGNGGN